LGKIGRESRENYLTNLFGGRQRALTRGGGGRNLSSNPAENARLQEQIRQNRAAFDLARGANNLPVMGRLATELSGLLQQQNEFNRIRTGRSVSFEAGRRGQETITELSQMPGADPRRIRRLRGQATEVIAAGYAEDIAGARDATRRMKASIGRYERELNAAAKELRLARARGGPSSPIRGAINVPGSPAALERSRQIGGPREAIRGRADLPGSPAYLEEQRKQLARAVRMGGPTESIKGRKDLPGSPAYYEEQRKQLERAVRAGGPSLPIRGMAGIAGSPAALERSRRMGGAREPIGGRVDLPGSPAYLEEQKRQQAQQLQRSVRAGGPRESIKGRADLPGSPAYYEEQQKQLQKAVRMGGPTESIRGRKDLPGSPAFYEEQRRQLERAVRAGGPSLPIRGMATVAGSPAALERSARLGGPREPIRGRRDLPGSPLYLEAQQRELDRQQRELDRQRMQQQRESERQWKQSRLFQGDRRKALGEGLIGGAFPLLFGQGVGASVGGFAGGFGGGLLGGSFGFGLSLIGTALGSVVDTTSNNLKELASSLKSPNDAIAALEASGFRVGGSLKLQVEQLQSVGRAYDAQALVLQEIEKRLGAGSVAELQSLETAQKRLQEATASLTGQIQRGFLPALENMANFLTDAINRFSSLPRPPEWLSDNAFTRSSWGGMLGLTPRDKSNAAPKPIPTLPLTPQEKLAKEKASIDESRRLADQIQSAYREAFKLQRQGNDLQREGAMINKEIADYSYKKESEIFALRQQALEKQIENTRAAAQNRIEGGDLSLREAFATATGFEQQLLGNVREAMRARREGEADIEQSRKKLELTMAKLNRDTEDYKRTTAREIEDIERRKLAYTRSVEDYKMSVADYVLQRSRESADLMRQAMTLPDAGGGAMGGSNANVIANSLINRLNLTPAQAAGVVGNFMRESGANINPMINEGGAVGLPAGRGGYGIAQWTGSRQSDLVRFAGSIEKAGDLGVQIDFLIKELRTSEAGALRSLRAAGTPEEAAKVFEQGFERAGIKALAERQQNARQFFNSFAPGAMGMPGGVIARTGATGIGTAAHLDVRWADGRPITSADADRFIRVAGRAPSSFGVSSGYGPRRAPVPGASTFHRGIDFPTPAGSPISLTGGARLTGSMTEAQSGGGGIVGIIDTPMGQMKLLHLEKIIGNVQAGTAAQISNIPRPGFSPAPIGPTPDAAPINAQREALRRTIGAGEQEAQKILEQQIKLRQQGIELGQLEAILQNNQLPQLEQQGDALNRQIEARRRILDLSDDAASASDIEAEREARLTQILKDRQNALDKVQKQITDPKERDEATRSINRQASAAIGIAVGEEDQRRKNLDLNNQLQSQDRARLEILRLQEGLTIAKVEAAALERGELEASGVELLKASQLYRDAEQAQRDKLVSLAAETEELRKQNEFTRRMNEGQRDIGLVGAGLRAGLVGTGARAFEQGLRDFDGDTDKAMQFANQAKAAEDAQLIWGRLEQNVVDVSEAISGGLTNGLLDIIDGSRRVEEVGRDVLRSMANSFAESAQQQLSTLMQRKLGGMLGGPEGMLTKLIGGGTEAAGAQALGLASMTAAGQVAFFGTTLQTVAAQAALSGAMGGGSSLLGSAIPSLVSGFAPGAFSFGGFFAEGGVTTPGKGYVVGDGGEPEFFFPGVTGRVVPRSDMEKAAALQDQGNSSETIDLRYTVTEQRGERYVTEAQFRRSNAMLLARSQAATYSGMRGNKEVREFVGI
jgi:murein DD-endopeptidase MepM/ murein hydrolase activator NlpD